MTMKVTPLQHFQISEVRATQAALERISNIGALLTIAQRHANSEWMNMPPEMQQANRIALTEGGRLLSLQTLSDGGCVWVISGADRTQARVCLPAEIALIN